MSKNNRQFFSWPVHQLLFWEYFPDHVFMTFYFWNNSVEVPSSCGESDSGPETTKYVWTCLSRFFFKRGSLMSQPFEAKLAFTSYYFRIESVQFLLFVFLIWPFALDRTLLLTLFLFCSCVYFYFGGPFNRISFHKFSKQLSAFSLFFWSSFCLIGPFNYISLYESLPQPWYNP